MAYLTVELCWKIRMADNQALTTNASGSEVGSIPTPPSVAGSTPEESTRGGETNTNPASSDAPSLTTAAQSGQSGKRKYNRPPSFVWDHFKKKL